MSPENHQHVYGEFVKDEDGHEIAVCTVEGCDMARGHIPSVVERVYAQAWMNCLQYSEYAAQEASMYALRSHGYDCIGQGYNEDFRWLVRPPGKNQSCVIDPLVKDIPVSEIGISVTALIDTQAQYELVPKLHDVFRSARNVQVTLHPNEPAHDAEWECEDCGGPSPATSHSGCRWCGSQGNIVRSGQARVRAWTARV